MATALQEILKAAIKLPRQQQLALASFLLALEEADGNANADAVWKEEIRARIQAIDNGTAVGISYAEIMREAQCRIARSGLDSDSP